MGAPFITIRTHLDWMTILRLFLGEFLGTAIMMVIGCTGIMVNLETPRNSLLHCAFAFGLAIMLAVTIVGHISGSHINPIVTLVAVLLGDFPLALFPVYFFGQVIGSLAGTGLHFAMVPYFIRADHTGGACSPARPAFIPIGMAILSEAVGSSILCFLVCAVWDPRNKNYVEAISLKFGFGIAALVMAFGSISGCNLNPARSIGPAILNNYWVDHWVYWVGPISGAIVAAYFYRYAFLYNVIDREEEAARSVPRSASVTGGGRMESAYR